MKEIEVVKEQPKEPPSRAFNDISYSTSKKRTLRMSVLLDEIDEQREIYPKGMLGSLRESSSSNDSLRTKRIELFAHENEKSYGILREFFVAFSSEERLLELAVASSNVIAIHAFPSERKNSENKKTIEDRLVLKRATHEKRAEGKPVIFRERIPDLFVSEFWLDRMRLSSGDRIIISNPREIYEVPPPTLSWK